MRTSTFAAAGLVAVASAKTYTVIETVQSTVTSCGPDVTNCPASQWNNWNAPSTPAAASSTTWATWSSGSPVAPTTTGTWSQWTSQTPAAVTSSASWSAWSSASAACPSYTDSAPPAWFSQLPSNVLSSMEAKWTAGPPSDWCYYTYSTGAPVAPATTPASTPAAASTWAAWTPSSAAPAVSTYTGAANVNGASLAIAGLAAAAAVVLA